MTAIQLSEAVRYERDGDLAVLTISNPPLNLYTAAVSNGVGDGITRAETEGARALLLRAEGRFFSAGVDVRGFAGSNGPGTGRQTGLLSQRLEDLPMPTIAAVHALCLTAAFELILGCDLIVAGQSATFGLIETTIGLTPLAGGTQRIAYRAGTARAAQVVLSGERYDAATFERWNIINLVVPDAELDETARALGHRYAAGPTLAYAATKQLLGVYRDRGLRAADEAMPAITAPLRQTEDHKNAVRTFFEQGPGKATFAGR
jgi:enoyl-CoA hydratase/carnithine racemase